MRNKKNLKNYITLSGIALVGALTPTTSAFAGDFSNNGYNSGLSENTGYAQNQIENSFHSAGITSTDIGYDIFNYKDSSGEPITADKIQSIMESGGEINLKLEYKDDELGKQMADLFGEDTYALQHFIDNQNISSTEELSKEIGVLVDLKNQINNVQYQS